MEIVIKSNADAAATLTAQLIAARVRAKPDLVLGLATGRTMEGDLVQFQTAPAVAWEQPIEPTTPVQGSSLRGIILHKLMEEFLTGELDVSPETAARRSLGLIRELVPDDTPTPQLDVQELAAAALRTIALKELSDDRDNVIAEVPVYGSIGAVDRLIAGRADAVRYRNGDAEIVFD
jgi:CRISPR-associated exonuclease Cas4